MLQKSDEMVWLRECPVERGGQGFQILILDA